MKGSATKTERFATTYTYRAVEDGAKTTNQVATIRNYATAEGLFNQILRYEYDKNGNIISYKRGANEAKYAYDEAGQLIRKDNQGLGKSWTWAYDLGGYILEKKEDAYTTGELGES